MKVIIIVNFCAIKKSASESINLAKKFKLKWLEMAKRKFFASLALQLVLFVITGSAAVPVKREVEEMGNNDQNVSVVVDKCIINYFVDVDCRQI